MSCSSLLIGNMQSVEERGGKVPIASQSSQGSSYFRTTAAMLGARSITAFINSNCCSSGLKPIIWSSFKLELLDLANLAKSHEGFALSWRIVLLSLIWHGCSHTYIKQKYPDIEYKNGSVYPKWLRTCTKVHSQKEHQTKSNDEKQRNELPQYQISQGMVQLQEGQLSIINLIEQRYHI